MSRSAAFWRNLILRSAARVFLSGFVGNSLPAEHSARRQAAAQSAQPSTQPATKAKAAPSQTAQATPRSHSRIRRLSSLPQEAASALYSAARGNDENDLLVILGPDAADIIHWTDNAEDRKAEPDQFAQKYDQMHRLVKEPDGETTLYIGAENWPLPIPLVQSHGAWFFDTSSAGGRFFIAASVKTNSRPQRPSLHRGRAERVLLPGARGDGAHVYAAHFDSGQGARDGLYWSSTANDSPLGPYLARAGYDRSDRVPLHGYFFRVLAAQGANAPGGAKSYLVNGKMTGGFAVVAFPAEYRVSGVKTFIVNQNGIVYERDLGPMTTEFASAMKAYNPDSSLAQSTVNSPAQSSPGLGAYKWSGLRIGIHVEFRRGAVSLARRKLHRERKTALLTYTLCSGLKI